MSDFVTAFPNACVSAESLLFFTFFKTADLGPEADRRLMVAIEGKRPFQFGARILGPLLSCALGSRLP